jgi:hypothetical protein
MADNLALKLLIAGVIGAVVGAAAADRYHMPAGAVYGVGKPMSSQRVRPSAGPAVNSAEKVADDSIGPPRIMRSFPSDRLEAGPNRPTRWRAPARAGRSARTAICWREYEDLGFGTVGYFVRCTRAGGRNHRPAGHGRNEGREQRV